MTSKIRTIVYPGSFDPVTMGHVDIVRRAAHMFDHVIVAVARNAAKTGLFNLEERRELLSLALRPLIRAGRVSVDSFEGLMVNYARSKGAVAVARGLRAVADFEYEFQMALMNRHLAPDLETVYLMPDEKYTYLSSTMLKEVVRLGGDVRRFVPPGILPRIRRRLDENRRIGR
jgi:pantetheine-phosphate adenylyltransferase